jgi:CRP-like cAMP-binding protein
VATTDCEVLVIEPHAAGALAANYPDVVAAWRELVAIRSSRLLKTPDGTQAAWAVDAAVEAVDGSEDS